MDRLYLPGQWRRLMLIASAGLAVCGIVAGADWPQWRGPSLNGSTSETNLPTQWSTTENLAWVAPLPGRSGATPIVSGDAIFLPSPDPEKNLHLLCIERKTGAVRWRRPMGGGDRYFGKNNMASPSAVTDGQVVVGMVGTGELAAFDFAGQDLWRRSLAREQGTLAVLFQYGSSPLLHAGRLYVQVLQRNPPTYGHVQDDKPGRESYLLCLEPATGKELWRHVRNTDAREEAMECYTTPMPLAGPQGAEIVVVGADAVTGHRPDTGQELWRYAGLNVKKIGGGRIVPSATVTPGLIFACGPKREKLVALRAGVRGALSEDHVAWTTAAYVPDVCTPLYYRDTLFVLDGDRQTLTAYDPPTGARRWQGRFPAREIFSASPTGADGRLYCLSEEGTVVVADAGAEFKILATIAMGEGPCHSSIAAAHGQLFIRTAKSLYCVGRR
jgi:outer membrane protein assembly factor BamB